MPPEHDVNAPEQRQLAAILFADIMGYTAMMHADEDNALRTLARFEEVLKTHVSQSNGKIIQFYGDGCLAHFPTAAEAVHCARDMQLELQIDVPVRMGIHVGDVVFKDGNAFGDSVNIASRIESMGIPGAVLFSSAVHDAVRNKKLTTVSLGEYQFKNVTQPMEVYALQHDGLSIPNRANVQGKFEDRPRKNLVPIGIGSVVIIAVAMLSWYMLKPQATGPDTGIPSGAKAIAIFPFEYGENDAELTYLSDGIPENLINRLSALPELKVFSRNASFTLRDTVSDLKHIRKLLNADAILTGQLTKVNDYLVINCQLIDLRSENQIWGKKITQKAGRLLELEDSLVTALVHPLRIQLQGGAAALGHSRPVDPEAYAHYLRGRFLSYGSTLKESETAIDHFRKAVELDPQYAEAYAAIANEKIVEAIFATASRDAIFGEARTAAQSAIALDSTLTEPYLVQAAIEFYGDYNWQGADSAYRKALQMDPNDPAALIRYSAYLAAMGRNKEAMPLAIQAVRTDPVSISSLHNLGWVSMLARDYTTSQETFAKALELHPNWIWGHVKKAYAHIYAGEYDAATPLGNSGYALLDGWDSEVLRSTFIYIQNRSGHPDEARRQAAEFYAHIDAHSYEDPLSVMFVHYAFKEYDQAIDWAERMVKERSPSVYLLIIESFWDEELYFSPRYQELLDRIGV
jgi:class 3 adenylate cyclase/TolB-like protein/Tfp pilus assembly protein PilF